MMGRILVLFLVGLILESSQAATPVPPVACNNVYTPVTPELLRTKFSEINRANLQAARAFGIYDRLIQQDNTIAQILRPAETLNILNNDEMVLYHDRLSNILLKVEAETAPTLPEKVVNALRAELTGKVPQDSIEARIQALQRGDSGSFIRALGEMTLEETQILVHGGNPLSPTPESLVGKYLQETGAASIVRTFPRGPGDQFGQGPQRLAIAVSAQTMPIFLKYFSIPNLLAHAHTRTQGTLTLSFEGKYGSYASQSSDLGFSLGSILPHIVLKTSEAQRAKLFFEAARYNNVERLLPWELPNYCAKGGYNSCTHWFGNIPIGDRLVSAYTFPGKVDQHASINVSTDPVINAQPRTQELQDYETTNPINKLIWKVPGHEQLSHVLGLAANNNRGEFANPGWVAHTLIGAASVERVPLVFYMTENHQAPLLPDFNLFIHAY